MTPGLLPESQYNLDRSKYNGQESKRYLTYFNMDCAVVFKESLSEDEDVFA